MPIPSSWLQRQARATRNIPTVFGHIEAQQPKQQVIGRYCEIHIDKRIESDIVARASIHNPAMLGEDRARRRIADVARFDAGIEIDGRIALEEWVYDVGKAGGDGPAVDIHAPIAIFRDSP